MSIRIVIPLAVVQEEAALPMRIDLSQTLDSSEDSERVQVRYALDPGSDVWFKDGTKKTERDVFVNAGGTVVKHRLSLVQGAGQVVVRASIRQTITDGLGIEVPDSTFVVIRREGT